MNAKYMLVIGLITIISICSTAFAADYITGRSILDNTIQATDLGADVTRVKSVSVSVLPSDPGWICPDDIYDDSPCVQGSPGLGVQRYTVSCPSGNVAGGGARLLDPEQGYNFELYASYPASDSAWTFDMYNTGPDAIPVQLRVICI